MEISPSTIVFTLCNFIILLVLLRLFLYKPVNRMLENRRKTIADSLAAAEEAQKKADTAAETIRAQIEEARKEADQIIVAARASGDELKKQIVEEARKEAQSMTESARAALAKEKEEAVIELRKQAAALAVSAAGRILAEELNEEQQRALLSKYMKKVGQLQ